MSLAKRGSRRIRVGDTDYRWVVAPDSGFMNLVIQGATGQGSRLIVQTDYDDEETPRADGTGSSLRPRRQITPGVVRSIILQARELGWDPAATGEVRFRLEGEDLIAR